MKISELIAMLAEIQREHGDLKVLLGDMSGEGPLRTADIEVREDKLLISTGL